jgi:endonuclease G
MDEKAARLGALVRCLSRRKIRNERGLALAELLHGRDIDPTIIETLGRQRARATMLNREDLTTELGQSPAASRKLFEAVIGKDDTLPSRFLTRGEAAAHAVGRITVRLEDGSGRYGTGSLLSHHLVITNNHVLESEDAARQATFELGYYETAPDTFPSTHQSFAIQPDKFFYTTEMLDFTLVGVATDNGSASTADYGALSLLAESGKALIGERVNIIQHAGGRPQSVSIRENQVVDIFDQWIHYAADTAPGSSGSPVFNDEWQLVGIHHASIPSGSNGGVVNEGIRASMIVQELTRAFS